MTSTEDQHEVTSHDARGGNAGPGSDHKLKVTVRTLAGHTVKEKVEPRDLIAEVTTRAVKHFVARGELAAGRYALTLPRLGGDAELDPTATVRDAGIVEHDVLVLVSCKPQVDG